VNRPSSCTGKPSSCTASQQHHQPCMVQKNSKLESH
jgi:hypothetical protein